MSDSPASKFFQSRGKPAPSLIVKVNLIRDGKDQDLAEGECVFRFVSDRNRSDAEGRAASAVGRLQNVTDEMRAGYLHAHFLHEAMRDKDNPASPFFDSADECMGMLVASERIRLLARYQSWVEEKFPTVFDAEAFKGAVEDARNFTVSDLLTKYGYDTLRNLLVFLAATRTSTPTP